MTQFLILLLNGLSLGAIYALIALGFVIIFKASEVVSFTHGSLLLLGAYSIARLSDSIGFAGAVVAFIWLYRETGDTEKVAALSADIFWLVLPSLVLFVLLPVLLRHGWNFWTSLGLSSAATALAYGAVALALRAWRGP